MGSRPWAPSPRSRDALVGRGAFTSPALGAGEVARASAQAGEGGAKRSFEFHGGQQIRLDKLPSQTNLVMCLAHQLVKVRCLPLTGLQLYSGLTSKNLVE